MERARPNSGPSYVCLHPDDWLAYADPTTPADLRDAIASAYELTANQKWYSVCDCAFPAEQCRVCSDRPVIGEYDHAT